MTADYGVAASAGFFVRAGDETDVGIIELHDATSVIVHLDLESGKPCEDGRLWLDGGSGTFDSGARLTEGEYIYQGVTLGFGPGVTARQPQRRSSPLISKYRGQRALMSKFRTDE